MFTVYCTWWVLVNRAETLISRGEDTCNWSELRVALGIAAFAGFLLGHIISSGRPDVIYLKDAR